MKWIKYIFGFYLILCLGLYFAQDSLVFNAEKFPESYKYRIGTEVEIPLDEHIQMNCLLVKDKPNARAKNAILYLHGNRGSIRFGVHQISEMRSEDCDILITDYRGYGKTEGEPISDQQLLSDVTKAFEYLTKYYDEENIIIVGYSLGTGMASYLGSLYNPKHIILIAPFTSLVDIKDKYLWMFPDFLLKYKLENKKYVAQTKVPITIIHGTEDKVVPISHSQKLKKINPSIEFITKDGKGHRRIIFDKSIKNTITRVLRA